MTLAPRARRMPFPAPTAIDRLIGVFSPAAMNRRLAARWQYGMLAGGYKGASKRRRATQEWATWTDSADGALLGDLPVLRERSRDLIRNNPLATGAVNTKVTSVVGTGLKLRPQIDRRALGLGDSAADDWERRAEAIWRLWADSQECDAGRSLTFAQVQDLAFRGALADGDVFALKRFIRRPGSPFATKLQLLEADRCSNPDRARDSLNLAAGVELGPDGDPVAYHFSSIHPGDLWRAAGRKQAWSRIPAFGPATGRRIVLHLHRKFEIGQTRGRPDLTPVIEALRELGDYTDAELQAAVIAGMFTVFVKSDSGAGLASTEPVSETGATAADTDLKLAPGMIADLAPGEEIQTADPGRPNDSFDPFVQAVLRQVGVALELPFEILIKHFTASYSAARAALLEAWKYYRGRRKWLADSLCQPAWEWVLAEAVAGGLIEAPGFWADPVRRAAWLGAEWYGDAMPAIDPMKENQANEIAEDRGWKTAGEITAELTGGDWERKQDTRRREKAMAGTAPARANAEPMDETGAADRAEDETEYGT